MMFPWENSVNERFIIIARSGQKQPDNFGKIFQMKALSKKY